MSQPQRLVLDTRTNSLLEGHIGDSAVRGTFDSAERVWTLFIDGVEQGVFEGTDRMFLVAEELVRHAAKRAEQLRAWGKSATPKPVAAQPPPPPETKPTGFLRTPYYGHTGGRGGTLG